MVSPRRIARIAVKLGRDSGDSGYPIIAWCLAQKMVIEIWAPSIGECCRHRNGFKRAPAKRMAEVVMKELSSALYAHLGEPGFDIAVWSRDGAEELLEYAAVEWGEV